MARQKGMRQRRYNYLGANRKWARELDQRRLARAEWILWRAAIRRKANDQVVELEQGASSPWPRPQSE